MQEFIYLIRCREVLMTVGHVEGILRDPVYSYDEYEYANISFSPTYMIRTYSFAENEGEISP